MKRVVHIITGLNAGGAERTLFSLLAAGLNERFDNLVVSLTDEGHYGARLRDLGTPVSAMKLRGGSRLRALLRVQRQIRKWRPGLIQGWMYHGNLMAYWARGFSPGNPALAWNVRHSLYNLADEKRMTRLVIRANQRLSVKPQVILYNSRLSRRQHEAFGFANHSGRVIPNGFDLGRWNRCETKGRALRAELGIPEKAIVVGHVARMHPMKDHAGFIFAAARVAQRHKDVYFVLCGRDVVNGNESLVSPLSEHMRPRFRFLGERGDVADVMRAMDVFCQSSWSEAFPNVLGEAMATEIPCVATDVGDSANLVGDTGLVVPPRDEAALVSALERFIEMPAEARRAIGAAARERIQSNYALEAIVLEYAGLYEHILSRKWGRGVPA